MAIPKLAVFFLFVFCSVEAQTRFFFGPSQDGRVLKPPQEARKMDSGDEKMFEQKIDHFSGTDFGSFSQRYYENNKLYDDSGIFFLRVGGESSITEKWMNNGEWYGLARKHGAAMFYLEHRYYGKSQPYENISTPNLRYLSSKYAVEDIALFITKINKEYNVTTTSPKWILFGGSYAGSLAVWSRLKYPHLIRGVVASSAPLLAKLDFHEYFEVVTESLKSCSDQCVTDIRTAMGDLDNYFSKKDVEAINSKFKFCNDLNESLDDWKDVTLFFVYVANFFGDVVEKPEKTGIPDVCDYMTNKNNGYSEVNRLSGLLIKEYNENCIPSYNDYVTGLKKEEYTENSSTRLWRYQTCTEFGFYQTLASANHVFGNRVSVDFYTNLCVDVFGPGFNSSVTKRGIEYSNIFGGQKNIETSNVVLVNGKLDPWHPLGIYETLQKDPVVIFVSGTTHCQDMSTYSEDDSEEVKNAKKTVENLVGQWLLGNRILSTFCLLSLCVEKSTILVILPATILIGLGTGVVIYIMGGRYIFTDRFFSKTLENKKKVKNNKTFAMWLTRRFKKLKTMESK